MSKRGSKEIFGEHSQDVRLAFMWVGMDLGRTQAVLLCGCDVGLEKKGWFHSVSMGTIRTLPP